VLQLVVAVVIGSAILIPLALIVPWFPAKASTQAGHVHTLYDVLLIATVPIFVLVVSVVLYSVWNFRMRPGEEKKDGPPIHGNTRLEVVWTAVPAVLIIALCTYAYTVLRSNEANKAGAMTVNVTERQFAFEFSYPDAGNRVSPVLYLPKGRPVVFKLRSLDVIHSFFVPEFSEKLDAVPGITTTLRVTPTRLGNYPAECTELCGAGHSLMRASVYVVQPAVFQHWLATLKAGAPAPIGQPGPNDAQPGVPGTAGGAPSPSSSSGASTSSSSSSSGPATSSSTSAASGAASAGKAVFLGAAGCSGCHTLAAAGATGTVGPDLDVRLRTDCASAASKKIRGATLSGCIHAAIVHPYAFIPSGFTKGVMPSTFSQTLTGAQIQSLVSYLGSVAK
jgi:cytochrome c oxidase subunit 2